MITHNMTDRELILTLLRYKKYCKLVDIMVYENFGSCVFYNQQQQDIFDRFLAKRSEMWDSLDGGRGQWDPFKVGFELKDGKVVVHSWDDISTTVAMPTFVIEGIKND